VRLASGQFGPAAGEIPSAEGRGVSPKALPQLWQSVNLVAARHDVVGGTGMLDAYVACPRR
jgi:hypothetical protein